MTFAFRGAELRINLTYLWCHGRLPQLTSPALFTELVQLRKLHDRDERMPRLADKVTAKSIAANKLGRDWVIPMLWSGGVLPAAFPWKGPVVVKARHSCNQNAFVHSNEDWEAARRVSTYWMRHDYGQWLDEWAYREVSRGLLVEPRIGADDRLPTDYKVFVFGGQATHIQVHLGRDRHHQWVVHDRNWRTLANSAPKIARPTALAAMLSAAEEMAREFDFARVDFYQPDAQPLFGEVTFYPGSGLLPINPSFLDAEWGRLWLNARVANSEVAQSQIILAG